MPLPAIPADINVAPPSLLSELLNNINTLIDASIPTPTPTEGNDELLGTVAGQTIDGQSGNDVIAAFGGNDTVVGGFGEDYALGGGGLDTMTGGDGNDYLFGQGDIDTMSGGAGNDALFGGVGSDILDGGDGDDSLFSNGGHDSLTGGAGNDLAQGGNGVNTLSGGAGDDELRGGAGADTIDAGVDNDFIEAGIGLDTVTGGLGDDVFFFAASNQGRDVITDFQISEDRFELLGVGFGVSAGTNLDDGVTFIANAAPTAVAALGTVLYETDTGRLYWDVDGTGAQAAVLIARLTGAPTVTEQDFIFV